MLGACVGGCRGEHREMCLGSGCGKAEGRGWVAEVGGTIRAVNVRPSGGDRQGPCMCGQGSCRFGRRWGTDKGRACVAEVGGPTRAVHVRPSEGERQGLCMFGRGWVIEKGRACTCGGGPTIGGL